MMTCCDLVGQDQRADAAGRQCRPCRRAGRLHVGEAGLDPLAYRDGIDRWREPHGAAPNRADEPLDRLDCRGLAFAVRRQIGAVDADEAVGPRARPRRPSPDGDMPLRGGEASGAAGSSRGSGRGSAGRRDRSRSSSSPARFRARSSGRSRCALARSRASASRCRSAAFGIGSGGRRFVDQSATVQLSENRRTAASGETANL